MFFRSMIEGIVLIQLFGGPFIISQRSPFHCNTAASENKHHGQCSEAEDEERASYAPKAQAADPAKIKSFASIEDIVRSQTQMKHPGLTGVSKKATELFLEIHKVLNTLSHNGEVLDEEVHLARWHRKKPITSACITPKNRKA